MEMEMARQCMYMIRRRMYGMSYRMIVALYSIDDNDDDGMMENIHGKRCVKRGPTKKRFSFSCITKKFNPHKSWTHSRSLVRAKIACKFNPYFY